MYKNSKNDLTIRQYVNLLNLAKNKFSFTTYDKINLDDNFILWRHDIDLSLNRALVLAKEEHALGVQTTYFVNMHSEYYNIYEKSQYGLINEILNLGHSIGLHFDTSFYTISDENSLEQYVSQEKGQIEELFQTTLSAFSFHNPSVTDLQFLKDSYAGLVNCYSDRFQNNLSYCSDSNGIWRYENLQDFLASSDTKSAQVLTHPGWWQDFSMTPRSSISRALTGRALAISSHFDRSFEDSQHAQKMYGDFFPFLNLRKTDLITFEVCSYFFDNEDFGQIASILVCKALQLNLINTDNPIYENFLDMMKEVHEISVKTNDKFKDLNLKLIALISGQ